MCLPGHQGCMQAPPATLVREITLCLLALTHEDGLLEALLIRLTLPIDFFIPDAERPRRGGLPHSVKLSPGPFEFPSKTP